MRERSFVLSVPVTPCVSRLFCRQVLSCCLCPSHLTSPACSTARFSHAVCTRHTSLLPLVLPPGSLVVSVPVTPLVSCLLCRQVLSCCLCCARHTLRLPLVLPPGSLVLSVPVTPRISRLLCRQVLSCCLYPSHLASPTCSAARFSRAVCARHTLHLPLVLPPGSLGLSVHVTPCVFRLFFRQVLSCCLYPSHLASPACSAARFSHAVCTRHSLRLPLVLPPGSLVLSVPVTPHVSRLFYCHVLSCCLYPSHLASPACSAARFSRGFCTRHTSRLLLVVPPGSLVLSVPVTPHVSRLLCRQVLSCCLYPSHLASPTCSAARFSRAVCSRHTLHLPLVLPPGSLGLSVHITPCVFRLFFRQVLSCCLYPSHLASPTCSAARFSRAVCARHTLHLPLVLPPGSLGLSVHVTPCVFRLFFHQVLSCCLYPSHLASPACSAARFSRAVCTRHTSRLPLVLPPGSLGLSVPVTPCISLLLCRQVLSGCLYTSHLVSSACSSARFSRAVCTRHTSRLPLVLPPGSLGLSVPVTPCISLLFCRQVLSGCLCPSHLASPSCSAARFSRAVCTRHTLCLPLVLPPGSLVLSVPVTPRVSHLFCRQVLSGCLCPSHLASPSCSAARFSRAVCARHTLHLPLVLPPGSLGLSVHVTPCVFRLFFRQVLSCCLYPSHLASPTCSAARFSRAVCARHTLHLPLVLPPGSLGLSVPVTPCISLLFCRQVLSGCLYTSHLASSACSAARFSRAVCARHTSRLPLVLPPGSLVLSLHVTPHVSCLFCRQVLSCCLYTSHLASSACSAARFSRAVFTRHTSRLLLVLSPGSLVLSGQTPLCVMQIP
ncbi:uncharacterized protein LOC143806100 isoform X2 [Ranitomeya variabilis]|uniref:uncharacterized protein LOC143806100 isoform X2 n=1 Tax=Ranitomeya variabilis TaxID=490064 RepID=UPI0040570492